MKTIAASTAVGLALLAAMPSAVGQPRLQTNEPGGGAEAACTPALMARMRANGITEAQIAGTCR